MLKRITNILFSTRLMSVLFIAFAIAMAIGTFLDAGGETSPTPYSRELIYNAWWFELIMLLFAINFLGDRKSTRLNSSHVAISYAVFCLKKKNKIIKTIKSYEVK